MPWNKLVFSIIMLLLAWAHSQHQKEVDVPTIWIVVVAAAPWILTELQNSFKSIKVGGAEIQFKDLKEQVQNLQLAVDSGVGSKQAVLPALPSTSIGGAAKAYGAAVNEPVIIEADPNKGQFGGSSRAEGLELGAKVTAFPGSEELFLIDAQITGAPAGSKVTFVLHPTFRPPKVEVTAGGDGVATLKRVSWGAFTMGAEVPRAKGQVVRLELDLAHDVPGAPEKFRNR